jgi:hypothetical protein
MNILPAWRRTKNPEVHEILTSGVERLMPDSGREPYHIFRLHMIDLAIKHQSASSLDNVVDLFLSWMNVSSRLHARQKGVHSGLALPRADPSIN